MDIPALAGCWSRRQVSDWIDFSGDAPLRGYLGLTIRCLMPGSMT
jgi:hypothetical protein